MDLVQKIKEQGNQAVPILTDAMENYSSVYLYNKLCKAAKQAGWANIVEIVTSVLGGFPLVVDFNQMKKDELDEFVKEFGEKVIEKLTPEGLYNLPTGYDDSDDTYNRVFTIPATFTNVASLTTNSPTWYLYTLNNTSGFIVFHRDSEPTRINIGFYIGNCLSDSDVSNSTTHYSIMYSSALNEVKKEFLTFTPSQVANM